MPKVAYHGGRPAVDVTLNRGQADEHIVTVEHGHQIEVSASERDDLLSQGDHWREIKPAKKED